MYIARHKPGMDHTLQINMSENLIRKSVGRKNRESKNKQLPMFTNLRLSGQFEIKTFNSSYALLRRGENLRKSVGMRDFSQAKNSELVLN